MNRITQTIRGIWIGGMLGASAIACADDQELIDYRQHVMKTMGEQTAAINMILQQKAPPDNFVTHVRILAITAATAKKAFESKAVGGNAKPEVWSNWSEFAQRLDALVSSTSDLSKTAQAGGIGAAGPKFQAALTCKGCHDTFRVPKK